MLEYFLYLIIVVALANLPVYLWEKRKLNKWLIEHNKNHEKEMRKIKEDHQKAMKEIENMPKHGFCCSKCTEKQPELDRLSEAAPKQKETS